MFERKKIKRKLFVLSDIHGCLCVLKKELKRSKFDPNDDSHLLLILGDLFDRGEQNKETCEFLSTVKNKLVLRGNHEDILLKSLLSGVVGAQQELNGTVQTIAEFFPDYDGGAYLDVVSGKGRAAKDELLNLIYSYPDYFETDSYIFTHGWLPTREKSIRQNWRRSTPPVWGIARWSRWYNFYEKSPIPEGKTLVIGHTHTRYAAEFDPSRPAGCCAPFFGKGMIAIDGGVVYSDTLNVLVLEDTLDAPAELEIPMPRESYLFALQAKDKRVELMLNKGLAEDLRPGDLITYTDPLAGASFSVRVVNVHLYHDVSDIYEDFSPSELGFDGSSEDFVRAIRRAYHYEEVADHGMLAVVFSR